MLLKVLFLNKPDFSIDRILLAHNSAYRPLTVLDVVEHSISSGKGIDCVNLLVPISGSESKSEAVKMYDILSVLKG